MESDVKTQKATIFLNLDVSSNFCLENKCNPTTASSSGLGPPPLELEIVH